VNELWTTLLPLIIGSAVPPVHIIITILLLRARAGRITAVAWLAGMTTVRLAQGVVFGLVLGIGGSEAGGSGGPGPILSTLLLVMAIVFFVAAAKQLLRLDDEDAPPPAWMATVESMTLGRAFLAGAGILSIGVKFWIFTLGAIVAIEEAGLGQPGSTLAFLVFVVLAASIHLALIAVAYAMPARSEAFLGQVSGLLNRYNRPIMIVFEVVFGTWFLVKALSGFGVL